MAIPLLSASLSKIKGTTRLNFAYLQGAKAGQILLGTKPPGPPQIAEAQKTLGESKKVFKGVVFLENDTITFGTKAKPMGAWELLLANCFKAQKCGQYLPLVLRQLGDQEPDEISVEAHDEEGAAAPAAEEATEDAAKYKQLKDALSPHLNAAIRANPPNRDALLALLKEALAQEKDGAFGEATATLRRLAGSLPKTGAAPAAAPAAEAPKEPAAKPDNSAAEAAYKKRLDALLPNIKQAIAAGAPAAGDLRARLTEALAFSKEGKFDSAAGAFDQIEGLLGQSTAKEVPTPPPAKPAAEKAAPVNSEAMAALNAGFQKLLPKIKETLVADPASKGTLSALITAFKSATDGQDAAAAKEALSKLLAALKPAAPTAAPPEEKVPAPAAAAPSDEGSAKAEKQWQEQFAAVEPEYLDLLSTVPTEEAKLRALMMGASELAGEGKFTEAVASLDKLSELMGTVAKSGKTELGDLKGVFTYRKRLVELQLAVGKIDGQINAFVKKMQGSAPGEVELANSLSGHLHELTADLMDSVDFAITTAKNEEQPVTGEVADEIGRFDADLRSNPLVLHVDGNPYMQISIQNTLAPALTAIMKAMPAFA